MRCFNSKLLLSLCLLLSTGAFAADNIFSFQPAPKKNGDTVWRGRGYNLVLKPTTSLNSLKGHLFAVAAFPKGSQLARKLANDPRTVLFHPDTLGDDPGFAVLRFKTIAEIEDVAHEAHAGKGFTCGNLQLFDPTSKAGTPLVIHQPIHNPRQKLTELATIVDGMSFSQFLPTVEALSALQTRHSGSSLAQTASEKVKEIFTTAADGKISGFTVEFVTHTNTSQKSVRAVIPGTDANEPPVIIGAHLDTINSRDGGGAGKEARAPGADDDATGIAAIAEVIRTIAAQQMKFKRSIEFHAYAAEELGLVGSHEISKTYKANNQAVAAMMQLDMMGYGKGSEKIYFIDNDTSWTLNRSAKDLMSNYVSDSFVEQSLSGGTSDHASWNNQGFAAFFPCENPEDYNPYIHSSEDTTEQFDELGFAKNVMKLAVAFLGHYAGMENVTSASSPDAARGDDLKIAITAAEVTGEYNVYVAGPEQFASVEICRVDSATSHTCSDEMEKAEYFRAAGTRFLHQGTGGTIRMKTGEIWRFAAYGANNELLERRQIKILE